MARVKVVLWNVERLFRPRASALARAVDPVVAAKQTEADYREKIARVGTVLRQVTGGPAPGLLALVEVENQAVVKDVLKAAGWSSLVDVEVPGEQLAGYDIALCYAPSVFGRADAAASFNVHNRFSTRDILEVPLRTRGGSAFVVVHNHWPSRKLSNAGPLRIGAADFCSRVIERRLKFQPHEMRRASRIAVPVEGVLRKRWDTPVLALGDFNDEPFDPSLRLLLDSTRSRALVEREPKFPKRQGIDGMQDYLGMRPRFYNPCWSLLGDQVTDSAPGTHVYSGEWFVLDQFLCSRGMLSGTGVRFVDGSVRSVTPSTLSLSGGRKVAAVNAAKAPLAFEGAAKPGVSDHLPVVCEIDVD